MLGFLFDPDDGDFTVLRNVFKLHPGYFSSYTKKRAPFKIETVGSIEVLSRSVLVKCFVRVF
jgi:hypothetical protein